MPPTWHVGRGEAASQTILAPATCTLGLHACYTEYAARKCVESAHISIEWYN